MAEINTNDDEEKTKTEDYSDLDEAELSEIEESAVNKIKDIKEKLKKCETEKMEYLTGWQRTKADYINARKDEEKIREELLRHSTKKIILEFLLEILNVADAFSEAFKNSNFNNIDAEWKKGIEAIFNKLMKILEQYNVLPYDSERKEFNPEFHEAITSENVSEKENDNIVLSEFQKGYMIGDKVLRPARVKVGIYKENNK